MASHVLVATAFGTTLTRFAGLSVNTGLARDSMGIVQIARQRVFNAIAYVQKVSVSDLLHGRWLPLKDRFSFQIISKHGLKASNPNVL